MTEPLVRLAEERDVDEVAGLQTEWAEEDITWGQAPASSQEIAHKLGPFFYVVIENGRVAGFIYGSEQTSAGLAVIPAGERYVQIDELYVQPGLRNRGLGGLLLKSLLGAAKARGIERFKVYSATKDMDRIVAFYRRHGFKPWYAELVA